MSLTPLTFHLLIKAYFLVKFVVLTLVSFEINNKMQITLSGKWLNISPDMSLVEWILLRVTRRFRSVHKWRRNLLKIDVKITFAVDSNAHKFAFLSSSDHQRTLQVLPERRGKFCAHRNFLFFLIKTQRENISKGIFLHVFCKHKKPKWCQEKTKQKDCFF